MDLEYILGVISDGPTKSLAYRRLRCLASKFDMYCLLDEFQEVADTKVWTGISWPTSQTDRNLIEQKVPHRYFYLN